MHGSRIDCFPSFSPILSSSVPYCFSFLASFFVCFPLFSFPPSLFCTPVRLSDQGNMMVDREGQIRLGDFGAAAQTLQEGTLHAAQTLVGTPCWMAPEVVRQARSGYSTAADIWSLGITALELAFGLPPFAQKDPVRIMLCILQLPAPTPESYPGRKERAEGCSKAFRQFVSACLKKDPKQR